jgi:thiol-disulfide isomerase/thioredoxin
MRWLVAAVALVAATAHAKKTKLELTRDVTVVAFGSAACQPCRAEKPMLKALAKKYAGDDGVRVLVLSVDDEANVREYVRLFGGDGNEVSVPRLAVLERHGDGLERNGAVAGETSDDFVKEISAAIETVRAHAMAPPSPMWQSLHAK